MGFSHHEFPSCGVDSLHALDLGMECRPTRAIYNREYLVDAGRVDQSQIQVLTCVFSRPCHVRRNSAMTCWIESLPESGFVHGLTAFPSSLTARWPQTHSTATAHARRLVLSPAVIISAPISVFQGSNIGKAASIKIDRRFRPGCPRITPQVSHTGVYLRSMKTLLMLSSPSSSSPVLYFESSKHTTCHFLLSNGHNTATSTTT